MIWHVVEVMSNVWRMAEYFHRPPVYRGYFFHLIGRWIRRHKIGNELTGDTNVIANSAVDILISYLVQILKDWPML